jgi:hypothetical protein
MLTRSRLLKHYRVMGLFVAAIASCSLDDPTSITGADVLVVDVASSTAPADGHTRVSVTATLLGDTPTGTELTFMTDAGTFIGATGSNGQELKLKTPSRMAQAVLLVGVDPGVATVSASAGGFVVRDTFELTPVAPQSIELTIDVARVPANGQTAVTLTARALRAKTGEHVSRGMRVRFDVTQEGAPVPELSGSAETDAAGIANRRLVSRVAGVFRVIAAVGMVADTLLVEFIPP